MTGADLDIRFRDLSWLTFRDLLVSMHFGTGTGIDHEESTYACAEV
jgi:hypothetical protein